MSARACSHALYAHPLGRDRHVGVAGANYSRCAIIHTAGASMPPLTLSHSTSTVPLNCARSAGVSTTIRWCNQRCPTALHSIGRPGSTVLPGYRTTQCRKRRTLRDIAHAANVEGAQQQMRLPRHVFDEQGIRHLLHLPGPSGSDSQLIASGSSPERAYAAPPAAVRARSITLPVVTITRTERNFDGVAACDRLRRLDPDTPPQAVVVLSQVSASMLAATTMLPSVSARPAVTYALDHVGTAVRRKRVLVRDITSTP